MGTTHRTRLGIIALLAAALTLAASPPSPQADASTAVAVTVSWRTEQRSLADGRTYFVRGPHCSPVEATECATFRERVRPLVAWFHSANAAEDADTAHLWLGSLQPLTRDAILVFGVSEGGSKLWDAGICCTAGAVDELGYLRRVVDDVAATWTVDRARVGVVGFSNGGMLAERAACERPELVRAAVSLSGSYAGACDVAPTRIAQWHGANDQVAPLNGGYIKVFGEARRMPPAASLGQRMPLGSVFELFVRPGRGHILPWADFKDAVRWLVARLAP